MGELIILGEYVGFGLLMLLVGWCFAKICSRPGIQEVSLPPPDGERPNGPSVVIEPEPVDRRRCLFNPESTGHILCVCLIVVAFIVLAVYVYRHYRQKQKRTSESTQEC